MNLTQMLIRNALVGGGARLFTLLIGMIITPYLLVNLGSERFGIWALLGVVTGIVALGDFSFKTALIKHLASTWAAGDREGYRAITSGGLFFCTINALLLGVLLWWNGDILLDLLRIPNSLRHEAGITFALGVAGQLVTISMAIFPALCDARQRLDITNGIGMLALVFGTVLTIAAIEGNAGLPGVALAQFFAILFFFLMTAAVTRRLFGPFQLSPALIRIDTLQMLLGFGLTLHLSTVCNVINRQFDKFILSRWAGLGWVSSYELAMKWVGSAGSLQPFITAALLPAGSHLSTTGELERLRSLYFEAYRYLFLIGLPPFCFLATHASAIIKIWLGQPQPQAATMIVLLSVGYTANSLSNGMAFLCQGVGRPDIQAMQSVIQLLLNVMLSVVLFLLIGPLGAAIGTSLALLIGAIVFVVHFHRYLKISTSSLLRRTALVPFLASLASAIVSHFFLLEWEPIGRWFSLIKLAGAGLVFILIFLGICLMSKQIVSGDLVRLRTAWHLRKKDQ